MIRFNVFYEELLRYKNQYGNCLVPQNYRTENGIRLGGIVKTIRRGGRKLTKAEKERLNELGFVWHAGHTRYSFDKIIKFLEEYKLEYGDCLVPGK